MGIGLCVPQKLLYLILILWGTFYGEHSIKIESNKFFFFFTRVMPDFTDSILGRNAMQYKSGIWELV